MDAYLMFDMLSMIATQTHMFTNALIEHKHVARVLKTIYSIIESHIDTLDEYMTSHEQTIETIVDCLGKYKYTGNLLMGDICEDFVESRARYIFRDLSVIAMYMNHVRDINEHVVYLKDIYRILPHLFLVSTKQSCIAEKFITDMIDIGFEYPPPLSDIKKMYCLLEQYKQYF